MAAAGGPPPPEQPSPAKPPHLPAPGSGSGWELTAPEPAVRAYHMLRSKLAAAYQVRRSSTCRRSDSDLARLCIPSHLPPARLPPDAAPSSPLDPCPPPLLQMYGKSVLTAMRAFLGGPSWWASRETLEDWAYIARNNRRIAEMNKEIGRILAERAARKKRKSNRDKSNPRPKDGTAAPAPTPRPPPLVWPPVPADITPARASARMAAAEASAAAAAAWAKRAAACEAAAEAAAERPARPPAAEHTARQQCGMRCRRRWRQPGRRAPRHPQCARQKQRCWPHAHLRRSARTGTTADGRRSRMHAQAGPLTLHLQVPSQLRLTQAMPSSHARLSLTPLCTIQFNQTRCHKQTLCL